MEIKNTLTDGIKDNRNYGIDALRLLSMFFVTILHTLGHGGVLRSTIGIKNDIVYLLEIIAFCAVNCYAIISGFVMYSEKRKPYCCSKYITLWLQVIFYSVGISLFVFLIKGSEMVSLKELIKFALPVTTKKYWYFSAYTGLFFLIPFLNKLAYSSTKKQLSILIIVVFIVHICFGGLQDSFYFNGGYSTAWLAIMYMFGVWIKKCDIASKLKNNYAIMVLISCILITWFFKVFSPLGNNLFISYLSPTIVLSAMCWVIIFSKINIGGIAKNIIKFLSPAAFGVYLIHEHTIIKDEFITNKFIWISSLDWWFIPIAVIGCSLSIFIVCLIIEKARLYLFKKLKINKGAESICCKIEMLLRKKLNTILDYVDKT